MKRGPVWSAFALPVIGVSVQSLIALASYMGGPPRGVPPQWLVVTAADMDGCTLIVQNLLMAVVSVALVAATFLALDGDLLRAAIALAMGIWGAFTAVFTVPEVLLGTRYWIPPGALDPMPESTDFDYAAYVRQLLPQLDVPLAWALGIAVPLCLCVAATFWTCNRRRRRTTAPAADDVSHEHSTIDPTLAISPQFEWAKTKALVPAALPASVRVAAPPRCPAPDSPIPAYLLYPSDDKARAFRNALTFYALRGCHVVQPSSRAIFVYGPKGMTDEEFRALHRRAWGY